MSAWALVTHSSAPRHRAFIKESYCGGMLGTLRMRPAEGYEALYQVVIPVGVGCDEEEAIRRLVERHRGELKQLRHETLGRKARLHLYLGRTRIDDIVTALEGAGFAVGAVVATSHPR